MHPEVISNEPGNCTKCGMTLEPMMPRTAETKIIGSELPWFLK
jgi:heavy metal-binding protein